MVHSIGARHLVLCHVKFSTVQLVTECKDVYIVQEAQGQTIIVSLCIATSFGSTNIIVNSTFEFLCQNERFIL